MQYYSMCGCFTRKFKVAETAPPGDVVEAFRRYAEGGTNMGAGQLAAFLREWQGLGEDEAEAEKVVGEVAQRRRIHLHIANKLGGGGGGDSVTKKGLTIEDFFCYLFSTDLNPPLLDKVHQDMTKPLSHYYIYTGHNSYLTGNQLNSNCSDRPIIKALKKGVRVIELDLWPNKKQVHVKHGGTLTTPVDLLMCLKSIKEYAFVASSYPVVITLEDHLPPELQSEVAKMLAETFGDMIYTPESESLEELPSPEELQFRIIVSTKPPKEYLKAETVKIKDSDDENSADGPLNQTLLPQDDVGSNVSDSFEKSDEESHHVGVLAYKRLIAIHAGKPKGGLREALKVDPCKVRRLSLSEQTLEKAAEHHGTDTIRFTQKNVLRIYPKGSRITSSNYKPLIGWMHGAQMVAFNMQGYGKSLWLMHGMFRANGGCGYVLKPEFLVNVGPERDVFNPKAHLPPKRTLKVKIYMGDGWHLDFPLTHFDWFSPPHFYVRVGIAGVKNDTIMKQTKTRNNKWTPVWEEDFAFPLACPELALLRLEVREDGLGGNADFGGQTCLPVSELQPGIRALPLYNRKGEKYTSLTRCVNPGILAKRVGRAGVKNETIMKKTKTKNNKWTPVWDEDFEFPLGCPELALLRLDVRKDDLGGNDDFGGQNCLSVSELRPGIRALSLYNRKGERYSSVRLLVRFAFF